MNLAQFFEHWSIIENPFTGEEARDDAVFARLARMPGTQTRAAENEEGDGAMSCALDRSAHSDFEKILGSLTHPATSVVFGEKGSGKTALRMQIADHISRFNHASHLPSIGADSHCGVWVINYDDLNSVLDSLHEHAGGNDPAKSLATMRLVDHIDGLLSRSVTKMVSGLLADAACKRSRSSQPSQRTAAQHGARDPSPLPYDASKRIKHARRELKRDLLLLQVVYDSADDAALRTDMLRKAIRYPRFASLTWREVLSKSVAWTGWILPAGFLGAAFFYLEKETLVRASEILAAMTGVGWLVVAGTVFGLRRWQVLRLARKLSKQLRTLRRDDGSLAASLVKLARTDMNPLVLPITETDETRYAMLDRLKRVLDAFGYGGVIVLVDRVDEPTLINGDTERMRSVIWPMFNNKFLQQEGFALKMLLPIELRYALFKESSAFFQEARLDKQNLIERLSWTGSMLYDLCNARLRACRAVDAGPIALLDLFADDVTERDIVDALDQMHQPRDAFKLLYHCLSEHCSNVTAEQGQWRVPRLVLEQIRKFEAHRVEQLTRGIRPG